MSTVREHYDQHLGPIYGWMLGDMDVARAHQKALLERLDLEPAATGWAVDLGAGNGAQSLALADLGFTVLAVDACAPLLGELEAARGELPIETVVDDIRNYRRHVDTPPDVIVCMGDVLLHLESKDAVQELLVEMGDGLSALGMVVLGFRDLTAQPPGARQCLLVQSDDERLLTCVLDHEDEVTQVTDLIHTRGADGWTLASSTYPKLRLSAEWMRGALERAQLHLVAEAGEDGVLYFAARR